MANKPVGYNQQEQVAALPFTPRATPDMAGAGIGRAFQALGGSLEHTAHAINAKDEQQRRIEEAKAEQRDNARAMTEAHVQFADQLSQFGEWERQKQDSLEGDPDGHAVAVGQAWAKVRDATLPKIQNEHARQWAEVAYAQEGARRFQGAMAWQAVRATEHDIDQHENTLSQLEKEVAADPSRYESFMGLLEFQRGAGRYDPKIREKLRDNAEKRLSYNAAAGVTERAPDVALPLLNTRLGFKADQASVNFDSASRADAITMMRELTGDKNYTAPTEGPPITLKAKGSRRELAAQLGAALSTTSSAALGYDKYAAMGESKPIDTGKFQIQNPDGTPSTERTISFEADGKHYVIPTIVNGKQLTAFAATRLWKEGQNDEVGVFSTKEDAEAYAKARSAKIGELLNAGTNHGVQPYVDGEVPGGTPGKTGVPYFDALGLQQVEALRAKALTEKRRGVADLQADIRMRETDAHRGALNGEVLPIAPEATYITGFGEEEGKRRYAAALNFARMGHEISSVRGMTPEQYVQRMNEPRPNGKPGEYAMDDEVRDRVAQAWNHTVAARHKDWIAQAAREGIVSKKDIDWSKPDDALRELASRNNIALAKPKFVPGAGIGGALDEDEVARFRESAHRLDPRAVARIMGTMKQGLSDPRVFRATLKQAFPDSPIGETGANIMLHDDDRNSTSPYKAVDVVAAMVEGQRILNPDRAQRAEDGKPQKFPMPPKFRDYYSARVGAALGGNPGAFDRGEQAVATVYAKLASDAGLYTAKEADKKLVNKAVDMVIGTPTTWRTIPIIPPWGMGSDEARSALDREWARAMEASGYGKNHPLNTPEKYKFENAQGREGVYRIRGGSGFMLDKQGEPIELNINPPKMPRGLAEQVPR